MECKGLWHPAINVNGQLNGVSYTPGSSQRDAPGVQAQSRVTPQSPQVMGAVVGR